MRSKQINMEKRIQTWSMIKNGIRTPYTGKIKTFEQYRAEIRTEKLVQKAYKDHLLQQLAEAKQVPVQADSVIDGLNEIKEMVKPAYQFFNTPQSTPASKKRISKKEKERLANEEYERQMDLKALAFLNKKGS